MYLGMLWNKSLAIKNKTNGKNRLLLDNFSLALFTMDKPMYIMAHGFTNSWPWFSIVMPLPMNITDGSSVLLWYSFLGFVLVGTCGHLWVSHMVMQERHFHPIGLDRYLGTEYVPFCFSLGYGQFSFILQSGNPWFDA
jgi:hypothetical protein